MTPQEIQAELSEPFAAVDVGWKPQSVKGNRALAIAYIDARNVMDRLDAVVGIDNWQDDYDLLPDGSVVCRLRVRVGAEWVVKSDVGGPSEQPDQGDRLKAAFSDALKRAAVKFGIGRYLYSLDSVWCDYDPVKRAFSQRPQLPVWALPKVKKQAPPAQRPPTPPAADVLPLWDDPEAFFERLKRAGREWPKVVAWLNTRGGSYHKDAGFYDVSDEHRKLAADALPKA